MRRAHTTSMYTNIFVYNVKVCTKHSYTFTTVNNFLKYKKTFFKIIFQILKACDH